MPPKLRQRDQLTRAEVENCRAKSNARIVVEHVIGQLRIFRILRNNFLISKLYHLDDILLIAAGITNLHAPTAR